MNYQIYFQKASLKSYISLQVVVAFGLFILALLESALATFDLFLFGVPFVTFAIFYILTIFYPLALPLVSIFLITILMDIFLTSLQQSQTFAILISLLLVKRLLVFPEQKEFIEIWQGFGVAMAVMIALQAVFFMLWELRFVNIQGLFFQFGITMLFYPFIHVVVMRVAQAFAASASR
ncbi:MAG: hypothetical protein ACON49_08875 [Candidatus Puniceispirillaceae bacterium]